MIPYVMGALAGPSAGEQDAADGGLSPRYAVDPLPAARNNERWQIGASFYGGDFVRTFRDLDALPAEYRGGAAAIGNFDGVHWGHARLAERLRARAKLVGGPAIVFTFDPHPVRLLRPLEAPPPLTWTDRKAELLKALGVDAMIVHRPDEAFLALTDREFFERIVCGKLAARALVEGPNFFFGRDRTGDVGVLQKLTAAVGMQLEIVEPVSIDGQLVSSSRVRRLIAAGDIDAAGRLLTQPYRLRGMVTHGAARGAKLGFPTANVDAIDTVLPGAGVYAGTGFAREQAWPAAIHIGSNPTFGEHHLKVEVHLIDADIDLYGAPLEVDILARLRDTRAFAGVEALQGQLARDVAAARPIGAAHLATRPRSDK